MGSWPSSASDWDFKGQGAPQTMPSTAPRITINALTMAYGSFVIQRNLTFSIQPGEIFIIMGGSGCGKSTLLRHLIGLLQPAQGEVVYDGEDFWLALPEDRERMKRRFGVLYQSGALWSSMTLAENVALPLGEYTDLRPSEIREVVSLKLALVGWLALKAFIPLKLAVVCASVPVWPALWHSTQTSCFLTSPLLDLIR